MKSLFNVVDYIINVVVYIFNVVNYIINDVEYRFERDRKEFLTFDYPDLSGLQRKTWLCRR